MSERRIVCPNCGGDGEYRVVSMNPNGTLVKCSDCRGDRTIPDRRKPTANDRAVERIKPMLETFISNERPWDDKDTTARIVLDIIREEAERGE